jgi:hypothetical protein
LAAFLAAFLGAAFFAAFFAMANGFVLVKRNRYRALVTLIVEE